jgi:hypothetical protein
LGNDGSGSLRLAIRDLSDNGSRCLRLAVGDLRNNRGRGLRLAVGDLRNNRGRGLRLTVRDLGHDGTGSGSLGLTVGDLGDSGGSSLRLAIGDLRDTAGVLGHSCLDVDGNTLRTGRLAVQVVEVTRQALVEDSGALQGHGSVAAKTEALSLEGTLLNGRIELEPEGMLVLIECFQVLCKTYW